MTSYLIAGQNPDYTSSPAPVMATLFTMAQDILTRLVQIATQGGVILPDRRVIYMTPAPADCPQVAVLIGGWQGEPPWTGLIGCQEFRWTGRFMILITRKTCALPDLQGNPPSAALMTQAAQIASDDAELLLALVGGLGEIGDQLSIDTYAAEGGLQTTALSVVTPAFGGLG